MAITIPVIVLNWNGIQDTMACIASLLAQEGVIAKVFLGDNNSDNGEGKTLYEAYESQARVEVILFDKNHGFAKGSNLLMEQAMQDNPIYIAHLNNDAFAEPTWLLELYQTASQRGVDMVASKMIRFDERKVLDTVGHRMITTGEIVPIGNRESVDHYKASQENFGACAGACLYSTRMLKHIGLFDEYFHTGYEDAELGARAIVAGYKSVYSANAIVYHKVSQSVSKIFDMDYLITIQKSIYYTLLKVMPLGVIVYSMLGLLFKIPAMYLLNIITKKPKHNKMHREAIKQVWKDRAIIKANRKALFSKITPISTLKVRQKQSSFILFDITRLWKFRVKKSHTSEFDRVGD